MALLDLAKELEKKRVKYPDWRVALEQLESFCKKNNFTPYHNNKNPHKLSLDKYWKLQQDKFTYTIEYKYHSKYIMLSKIKHLDKKTIPLYSLSTIEKQSRFPLYYPLKDVFKSIKESMKDFKKKYKNTKSYSRIEMYKGE